MKTKIYFIANLFLFTIVLQGCCTPSKIIGSVNNPLRPQETRNWCWAAVTQMIAENESVIVSQCDLANHRFGKNNCCDFENDGQSCPKTDDCNDPGWPELDYAGIKFLETDTALSWEKLKKDIACRKNVLGFAYGTSGVVGHVVAIKGYFSINGTNYVVLNDPWEPCVGSERVITYEEYVDPAGTKTRWNTWYQTSKK